MNSRISKWAKFSLRWGVAVVGIAWVLSNIAFHDRVTLLGADGKPKQCIVVGDAPENAPTFEIIDPQPPAGTPARRTVSRDALWTRPDRRSVDVRLPDGRSKSVKFL